MSQAEPDSPLLDSKQKKKAPPKDSREGAVTSSNAIRSHLDMYSEHLRIRSESEMENLRKAIDAIRDQNKSIYHHSLPEWENKTDSNFVFVVTSSSGKWDENWLANNSNDHPDLQSWQTLLQEIESATASVKRVQAQSEKIAAETRKIINILTQEGE